MAKPAVLPRWANVGGAIVLPSSGKLDVGWVTAERPPAQYMNWWMNLVFQWITYVDQLFTVGGTVTDSINTSGAANIGGPITLSANQNVVISGTGQYKHGTKTLIVPGAAFEAGLSSVTYSQSIDGFSDTNNGAGAMAPIMLPIGAHISAIRMFIKDNVTGPSTVALRLNRYTAATDTSSNISTSSNSAGTGANQTLALAVNETVSTGVFHTVFMLNQSGTATTKCHGIEVDYDMP